MRIAMLMVVAALAFPVLACAGSGDKGSVTYAPTVVAIHHIDFTGAELGVAEFTNPSSKYVDQYPDVVATVNGQPVTGSALVYAQMAAEIESRNNASLLEQYEDLYAEVGTPTFPEPKDPLDMAIEDVILRQAIGRLNLLPPREEGVAAAQTAEAVLAGNPEAIATFSATNLLQGLPDEEWASDDRVVEGYRYNAARSALERQYCPVPTIPEDYTPLQAREPRRDQCADFLEKERSNADIVYYVRWAD